MKKTDLCYGLEHWEILDFDPDDSVERVLDEAYERPDEPFDEMLDRIEWPIRIFEFKRRVITATAQYIADCAIEDIIEMLDCDYGSEDEATEPTKAIKEAALALGKVVVRDYVPWTCEANGKVFEYTREQVKKECGEE